MGTEPFDATGPVRAYLMVLTKKQEAVERALQVTSSPLNSGRDFP
jgi:hypothetical protein